MFNTFRAPPPKKGKAVPKLRQTIRKDKNPIQKKRKAATNLFEKSSDDEEKDASNNLSHKDVC